MRTVYVRAVFSVHAFLNALAPPPTLSRGDFAPRSGRRRCRTNFRAAFRRQPGSNRVPVSVYVLPPISCLPPPD